MSWSFPKSRRLRKRRDFTSAQRASLAVRLPFAVLLLHRREATGAMRLGVVASRRVGGAVQRNRAKRLVREWFRHLDVERSGCDVVVVLRATVQQCPTPRLVEQLTAALEQAAQRLARRRRAR